MTIKPNYNLGDIVYLKTDINQLERMITGYIVRPNTVMYYVSCGSEPEVVCYDIEITQERNIIMSTSN